MNRETHIGTSILVIIVLYKTKIEDSLSYRTFCKNMEYLNMPYQLIIYNNSPEIYIAPSDNYVLITPLQNEMLATAYNYALKEALDKEIQWILLLDQDTYLTKEYFIQLNETLTKLNLENVAAIIPRLKYKKISLSPEAYSSILGPWGYRKKIQKGLIKNKTIVALNSTSLLSTKSLQTIAGFPLDFPLDMLDFCVYFKLSKENFSFYLLDVDIEHNLSVFDLNNQISIERYASIINAEYTLSKQIGLCCVCIWKFRLFFRMIKQWLSKSNRNFSFITFQCLVK